MTRLSFLTLFAGWALAALPMVAIADSVEIIPSPEAGWPQFRGPHRDGRCDETGLLQQWPTEGPPRLWSAEHLGRGFSSPIVVHDRIYLTGDVGDDFRVFALTAQGKPIWNITAGTAWKNPYPGARATPTFSAGNLYLLEAHGRLLCLDAAERREIWSKNILQEFGGANLTWGLSECLLVDEQSVYVTVGGPQSLLAAFDKKTGALRWKSPPIVIPDTDPAADSASYVAPILVRFDERRLILGCSLRHLYCADADTGRIEWTRRFPTSYNVLAASPAVFGDGVFMTAPLGKGGVFLRLLTPAAAGQPIKFEETWTSPLDTLQGSLVCTGDRLIGAYYGPRKGWAALNARTGSIDYQDNRWIKGTPLFADGRIYALSEDGWMNLLEAGPNSFIEHGHFRLATARNDAWAHPVISGGFLYLRYHERLDCYDIRASRR